MSLILGGGGSVEFLSSPQFLLNHSIRVNTNDNPRLTKTFSSSRSDGKKWTVSTWCKRTATGSGTFFYQAHVDNNNRTYLAVDANDQIAIVDRSGGSNVISLLSDALIRDTSAWYNIVFTYDSTLGTASDRVKVYLNGDQITITGSFPSLNATTQFFNTTAEQQLLARELSGSFGLNWDGYISEFIALDGRAFDSSEFGEFNSNGIWIPKQFTQTYGNNGFRLDFANSADLGNDVSGNNNDFTNTNFTADDQTLDTPTNNWPVFNINGDLVGNSALYREGGLEIVARSTNAMGTFAVDNGVWNWECRLDQVGTGQDTRIGIRSLETSVDGGFGLSILYEDNGQKVIDGSASSYGSSYASGITIDVLLDLDAGTPTVEFFRNGVSQGTINLSSSSGVGPWAPTVMINNNTTDGIVTFRPGSVSEFGTATGSDYLNSSNLSDPSVVNPTNFFNPIVYTGDGNSNHAITGVGFSPDLVWTKARGRGTIGHMIFDTSRSATNFIQSNNTNAEGTLSGSLDSFDLDGFTVGSQVHCNQNGVSFIAWCFKKKAGFFDIVTYTGDGTAGLDVNHNLGVVPELVIIKNRSDTASWHCLTSDSTNDTHTPVLTSSTFTLDSGGNRLLLNLTNGYSNYVHDKQVNANGDNYFAYLFSSLEGMSKVGSYTGNGSTDGPFLYCGFRPAFVMIKRTDSTGNWFMYDKKRPAEYNETTNNLTANTSNVENTPAVGNGIDLLSNGFKLRNNFSERNANGGSYIYLAIAEQPFKFARAR